MQRGGSNQGRLHKSAQKAATAKLSLKKNFVYKPGKPYSEGKSLTRSREGKDESLAIWDCFANSH